MPASDEKPDSGQNAGAKKAASKQNSDKKYSEISAEAESEHLWRQHAEARAKKERQHTLDQRHLRRNAPRILLFVLTPVYSELLLRALDGESLTRGIGFPVLFGLGFGCIALALVSFFNARVNRVIAKVYLIATAVLFSLECIVKSVFHVYMSVGNLLLGAGNVAGNYGGELGRSILFGIPKAFLFFIPFILFLTLFRVPERKKKAVSGPKSTRPSKLHHFSLKKWKPIYAFFSLMLGVLFSFASSVSAAEGSYSALYGAQFDFNHAAQTFGLITSLRLDARYSLFGNRNVSFSSATGQADDTAESSVETESSGSSISKTRNIMDLDFDGALERSENSEEVQELNSYVQSLSASDTNAYTGIFEGKNLILVTAESYCSAFISEELTPTLWRLTHNGFYFSNFYEPEWGGSTTTGECGFLTGLVPREGDQAMVKTEGKNMYFTMGNQLQRLGYSSCAFHNGDVNYYQRLLTHPNLGYNQFIGNQNGLKQLIGYSYAPDSEMVEATMPYYVNEEPFSIYYMTISGHAPYNADDEFVAKYYDQVSAIVGNDYAETTIYYICKQMELETAMTKMVEGLEEAGIADDTVIVLVGDHYPYGLGAGEAWGNDRDYIEDLLGHDNSHPWQQDENSLIIWSECLEEGGDLHEMQCEISTPASSIDVLPTLSNLFGLEYDSRLLAGRDVFSDQEPLVLWNNMDWVTERGIYDYSEETFYPNDGYEEDEAYIEKINSAVADKMLMSRLIVDNDYYGLLFGEDTVTTAGKILFPETDYTPPEDADDGIDHSNDDSET